MKRADIPIQKFKDAPIQIIDGDRGNNYPKDSEWLENGHCLFLNTGNVTESGFNFNNCQFISFDKDQIMRKGKLTRNDLVMTTRGTVGNVGYYNSKVAFENIRINSGMVIFRVDQTKILPSFLYQYLRSTYFNKQVNALRTGAAQPQLPIRDIKCIKIQIPQIVAQEKIASILSAYDDLIGTNHRRIQLLEESARLLFREWFVYFKFPNHKKVKIVDGVPEGWEREKINKLVTFKRGVEPGSDNYLESYESGSYPFYRVSDLVSRNPSIFVDEQYAKKAFIKKSDIVVSLDGSVGIVSIGLEGCYSTGIRKLVIKDKKVNRAYLYFLMKSHYLQGVINAYAKGTTIQHAGEAIKHMNPILPPQIIMNLFDEIANPILNETLVLFEENQKLAHARDLLLPRLMSGAIVV